MKNESFLEYGTVKQCESGTLVLVYWCAVLPKEKSARELQSITTSIRTRTVTVYCSPAQVLDETGVETGGKGGVRYKVP